MEYLPNPSSKENLKFSYQKSGWTSGSLIVKVINDEVIAAEMEVVKAPSVRYA